MPPSEPIWDRFGYTGEVQTFTVPDGFDGLLRFKVCECWRLWCKSSSIIVDVTDLVK